MSLFSGLPSTLPPCSALPSSHPERARPRQSEEKPVACGRRPTRGSSSPPPRRHFRTVRTAALLASQAGLLLLLVSPTGGRGRLLLRGGGGGGGGGQHIPLHAAATGDPPSARSTSSRSSPPSLFLRPVRRSNSVRFRAAAQIPLRPSGGRAPFAVRRLRLREVAVPVEVEQGGRGGRGAPRD